MLAEQQPLPKHQDRYEPWRWWRFEEVQVLLSCTSCEEYGVYGSTGIDYLTTAGELRIYQLSAVPLLLCLNPKHRTTFGGVQVVV